MCFKCKRTVNFRKYSQVEWSASDHQGQTRYVWNFVSSRSAAQKLLDPAESPHPRDPGATSSIAAIACPKWWLTISSILSHHEVCQSYFIEFYTSLLKIDASCDPPPALFSRLSLLGRFLFFHFFLSHPHHVELQEKSTLLGRQKAPTKHPLHVAPSPQLEGPVRGAQLLQLIDQGLPRRIPVIWKWLT